MRSRETLAVLLTGAATIWLLLLMWLSLAEPASGVDRLALVLGFVVQLSVVIAWDLVPRLPLWIIAGHGLIMVSLALGLIITTPAGLLQPVAYGLPWLVVGLVPAGLAMFLAAAVRWTPQPSLAH